MTTGTPLAPHGVLEPVPVAVEAPPIEKTAPPALDAYLTPSGRQLAVWCEHEHCWHRHGAADGHRGAHCTCPQSPYAQTGYVLTQVGPLPPGLEASRQDLSYIRGCRWDSCRLVRASRLRAIQSPSELPPPSDPLAVAHALAKGYADNDWVDDTPSYGGPLMEPVIVVDADETPTDFTVPDFDPSTDGPLTLRRWRGSWIRWRGPHWVELDVDDVSAQLYTRLGNAHWVKRLKDGTELLVPWRPNRSTVGEVLAALGSLALLPSDVDAPSWLDRPPVALDGTPAYKGAIVSCANGLLDTETLQLHEHEPGWLNLVSVPFDYDEDAQAPARWMSFLDSLWPDDPLSIEALQQFFGYVLSGRTHLQKIMLLVGPPRSGKGTIARVLQELIGRKNCVGPTLASLSTNFGLQPLIGKPLAIVADARLGGRDTHVVVERLLSISGEDALTVDRKYRDTWTGRLPTRLMVLSNELPHFGDATGAIATRFLVLSLTTSWLRDEDTTLEAALAQELPGILNWALDGLIDLDECGRFTEPAGAADSIIAMSDSASPMSAFVRDECEVRASHEVPAAQLYAAWRGWCLSNGRDHPGNQQTFGRTLRSVVPTVQVHRPRDPANGVQVRTYAGISLRRSETRLNPLSAKGFPVAATEGAESERARESRSNIEASRVSLRLSPEVPPVTS